MSFKIIFRPKCYAHSLFFCVCLNCRTCGRTVPWAFPSRASSLSTTRASWSMSSHRHFSPREYTRLTRDTACYTRLWLLRDWLLHETLPVTRDSACYTRLCLVNETLLIARDTACYTRRYCVWRCLLYVTLLVTCDAPRYARRFLLRLMSLLHLTLPVPHDAVREPCSLT